MTAGPTGPIDPNKGAIPPSVDHPISKEDVKGSPPLTNLSAGSVVEGGEGGFAGGDAFVPAVPTRAPLTPVVFRALTR